MSPTHDEIPLTQTDAILNVNMTNVTKLTTTNFLMWKRQVHALLNGYNLAGHLDGTTPAPNPTQTVADLISSNPAFTKWQRQDQLLYSALLGAMTASVQPLVSKADTAAQIWTELNALYANPSRAHVKQLRQQVKQWKKGTKSINEYIQGFTIRFDQLATLEAEFKHEDQVEFILEGLPEEYKTVVDQLEGRDVSPTITEIHEKLLNHEVKLQSLAIQSDAIPITANAVNVRPYNNNNNRNSHRNFNSNHHRSQQPWHNNNNRSSTPSWQVSPSSTSVQQAPRGYQGRCQICGIHGHSARTCSQLQQYAATPRSQPSSTTPWQPRAHLASASSSQSTNWLLDSGATHHLTTDLSNLSMHHLYQGGEEVTIADGSTLPITHTGSLSLPTQTRSLTLPNVLYVPNLHKNLLSVYRLCVANNVSVNFYPTHFQVMDLKTGARLISGNVKNELYEWPMFTSSPTALIATSPKTTFSSWHARLGHPSPPTLSTIISQFSLPCLDSKHSLPPCTHCLINKSHKQPFSTNTITSTKPLQVIYSDVWSSPTLSTDNYKYYVIFVDHNTRYTWLYPLKQKSHVKETFIAYKNLVENHFQSKIITLFSDNGGEFIALRPYLTSQGISHFTSPPHTPEHNGVSERKHRHIVETGLTLLHQASMPKEYWPYAFQTAVYLINRLLTPLLHNTSPYQRLFMNKPNYLKLKIFGCLCYPWLRPYAAHKLQERSLPCVFLGYSLTQSAYYCFHIPSGRLYVSRHVEFVETQYPFASPTSTTTSPVELIEVPSQHAPSTVVPLATTPLVPAHQQHAPSSSDHHRRSMPVTNSSGQGTNSTNTLLSHSTGPSILGPHPRSLPRVPLSHTESSPTSEPTIPIPQPTSSSQTDSTIPPEPDSQPIPIPSVSEPLTETIHIPSTIVSSSQPSPLTSTQPTAPSMISRTKTPKQPKPTVSTHSMKTRKQNNIVKPAKKFTLAATISDETKYDTTVPTTINQAMRNPKWRAACSEELNAQLRNQTFVLVPRPRNHNVIATKWIFTIKYLPDGSIQRYKARLVARGFNQEYGIDYAETFSPVVKSITIRLVLQIAVTNSWQIKQLDINNAFLQGTLEDEVYVSQPPGYVDPDHPTYVWRLTKALYGLKQAPRAWYIELKRALISYGFKNSAADTSVFIYQSTGMVLYVLVYVDDIIVTGNSHDIISQFLAHLADRFSLKEPTDLSYFLGIEAVRTANGLHLNQRKYVIDLLTRTNMLDSKTVTTPMASSPKLSIRQGSPLSDASEYRRVLGGLQYLSLTRPDLAYAVNRLSQFMHCPTDVHWQAVKRVLRYLAGTLSTGIYLRRDSPLSLHAFSDADWAGDVDDFLSTNAHIIYFGTTPIAWSSKKQKGVARSSTEAEYRSVANTASELRWVSHILTELGINLKNPPVIYCDNVGATYLSANPVFHSRMKHLALDYHFIRDHVQDGVLRVAHVSTKDQLADALTKPLPRARFTELFNKIGVTRAPPS